MSQTLKQKMTLGKGYSHDPRHFKFPRRMDDFQSFEDTGHKGDSIVGWVCVVLAVVLALI